MSTRGRIVIDLFCTLDLVAQAPGGPEEDSQDDFPFGGWQAPLWDPVVDAAVDHGMGSVDALLLGRRTYDIFAGFWPQHTDGPAGEVGQLFNRIPKYVVSRGRPPLDWNGSQLISVEDIDALRDRHQEVHVIGSVDLAQTLLPARQYDELNLWMYPIVLGQGKKVFPDGALPAKLRLIQPAVTGESGAVRLRYAPDGEPTTGDMAHIG